MAQHDYVIANQSGSSFRADLNNALAAIVSNNSGTSAPSTTYAYQWWADTTAAQLKLRNAANDGWIVITELDGTLLMQDGTSAAPGLPFASDLNTGLFRPSADVLGISTGGAERVKFTSTEAAFNDGSNDVDFRVESNNIANMLFIDAGNDRVGIGTGSPGQLLDVAGVARFGGEATKLTTYSDSTYSGFFNGSGLTSDESIFMGAGGTFFYNNGSQSVTIKSTGDVDVNGNIKLADSGTGASYITGTKAGNSFYIGCDNSTGSTFGSGTAYSPIIYTGAAAPITFSNSGTEKARLDSSGRLIIGQSTTPSSGIGQYSKLFVAGNTSGANQPAYVTLARGVAASTITSGQGIGFLTFSGNEGSSFAHIACHADADAGSSDYPGRLEFATTADGGSSSVTRMTLGSNGNLGVGAANTSTIRVYAQGSDTTASNFAFVAANSSGSTLLYTRNDGVINTGTRTNSPYNLTTASAANVNVDSAGTLGRSTSSIRYKTDVETLQDEYADALLAVRPVWYRSTAPGDTLHPDWGYWGFIAEEVAEIDPRLVFWKTHETTSNVEDGETVVELDEPVAESVQYDRFVPHLLNLIKRQQQAIETLEAKVSALENA